MLHSWSRFSTAPFNQMYNCCTKLRDSCSPAIINQTPYCLSMTAMPIWVKGLRYYFVWIHFTCLHPIRLILLSRSVYSICPWKLKNHTAHVIYGHGAVLNERWEQKYVTCCLSNPHIFCLRLLVKLDSRLGTRNPTQHFRRRCLMEADSWLEDGTAVNYTNMLVR